MTVTLGLARVVVRGQEEKFRPGAFGENLSIENLLESEACIGDVYVVGTARLQISKPRGPCRKVALRLAIAELAGLMRRTGRPEPVL